MASPPSPAQALSGQATADPDLSDDAGCYCPVFHSVIELIGRRWSGAILKVLFTSPRPFSGVRSEIPGLSDRLLTERLNELTAAGLIEKKPPGRAGIYHLSDMGQDLHPVFAEIESFGMRWASQLAPDC